MSAVDRPGATGRLPLPQQRLPDRRDPLRLTPTGPNLGGRDRHQNGHPQSDRHNQLLSQGRAVGVVVVGAIQDPRKDVLPQRDLFPIRIGLRLNEAEHIDLTLGRAARLRGAACDMIPDTLPGVGYVQVDGITEPVRVRFAHHTDRDLAALGGTGRPALTLVEGVA